MSIGEKRTLNAYYKRRFYRGRTAFARAADFIALRVILLIACYLWFSFNVKSIIAAAVLTAAAVGAISVFAELVKSVRLEKFILRENARLSKKLFSESLVLMPRSEFLGIVREYIKRHGKEFAGESLVYTAQTLSPVDEETVLCACRAANRRGCKSLFIFSSASVSQPARDIAARYDGLSVVFISGDMLASCAKMPDDNAVRQYILKQAEQKKQIKKQSVSTAIGRGRCARYLLVAAALFALSFFVSYTLYYRMLAGACVSLAALSFYAAHSPSAAPKDA